MLYFEGRQSSDFPEDLSDSCSLLNKLHLIPSAAMRSGMTGDADADRGGVGHMLMSMGSNMCDYTGDGAPACNVGVLADNDVLGIGILCVSSALTYKCTRVSDPLLPLMRSTDLPITCRTMLLITNDSEGQFVQVMQVS